MRQRPNVEAWGGEDWDGGAQFQESAWAATVARDARIAQAAATSARHQREAAENAQRAQRAAAEHADAMPGRAMVGVPAIRAAMGVPWGQYGAVLDEVAGFNGGTLAAGFNVGAVARTVEDIGRLIGFNGPALVSTTYTATSMNEGGESTYEAAAAAINPELALRLNNYRVEDTADPYRSTLIDQDGARIGTFRQGDKPTGADKIFEAVVVAAVVAMTAGAAAYALAPALAGAGASGAGAAFEGIGGAMAAGGAPMTAAEFVAGVSAGASAGEAAFVWNAAADSQIASTALGITGAEAAAAAVVPLAVDLGTLGGIVTTAAPSAAPWAVPKAVGDTGKTLATNAAKSQLIKAMTGDAADGAPAATPIAGSPQAPTTSAAEPTGAALLLALALAAMAVF